MLQTVAVDVMTEDVETDAAVADVVTTVVLQITVVCGSSYCSSAAVALVMVAAVAVMIAVCGSSYYSSVAAVLVMAVVMDADVAAVMTAAKS